MTCCHNHICCRRLRCSGWSVSAAGECLYAIPSAFKVLFVHSFIYLFIYSSIRWSIDLSVCLFTESQEAVLETSLYQQRCNNANALVVLNIYPWRGLCEVILLMIIWCYCYNITIVVFNIARVDVVVLLLMLLLMLFMRTRSLWLLILLLFCCWLLLLLLLRTWRC